MMDAPKSTTSVLKAFDVLGSRPTVLATALVALLLATTSPAIADTATLDADDVASRLLGDWECQVESVIPPMGAFELQAGGVETQRFEDGVSHSSNIEVSFVFSGEQADLAKQIYGVPVDMAGYGLTLEDGSFDWSITETGEFAAKGRDASVCNQTDTFYIDSDNNKIRPETISKQLTAANQAIKQYCLDTYADLRKIRITKLTDKEFVRVIDVPETEGAYILITCKRPTPSH